MNVNLENSSGADGRGVNVGSHDDGYTCQAHLNLS